MCIRWWCCVRRGSALACWGQSDIPHYVTPLVLLADSLSRNSDTWSTKNKLYKWKYNFRFRWGYRHHFSIKATHNRRSHAKSDRRGWPWSGSRRCPLEDRCGLIGDVWICSSLMNKWFGCNGLPGTAQSGSATASGLDPRQLRPHSLSR